MEKLVVLLIILPCINTKTLSNHPKDNAPTLRFAVIGDWGGLPIPPYYTQQETMVAAELAHIVSKWGADFIVSVGDNFYYDGVTDVMDLRFQGSGLMNICIKVGIFDCSVGVSRQTGLKVSCKWMDGGKYGKKTFENVFDGESLLSVPWYVIAGNHDHNGNVTAQIAYSNLSSRWKYPDLYYDLSFKIPNANVSVRLLMIDTIILCGDADDFLGTQPLGAANSKFANEQLDWLKEKLQTSKDEYLLVAGHYPVWSIAEHGPTSCLLHHVEPLLKKYRVTAYLCGHDHNMQYLQDDSGIGYVLSGAGNFMENSRKHEKYVPEGYLRFFQGDGETMGSFVYMQVTPNEMNITYIQSGGKSLFQTTLYPRKV